MSFIIHKRQTWRTAALILIIVAMFGPWAYDLISVPAQYSCDAPFVRLQGDFCGQPVALLLAGPGAILGTIIAALTGNVASGYWFPQVPVMLTMIFVFVPPLTVAVLLRRDEPERWQMLNAAVLALAATGAAVYLGLQLPRPYGPPWGGLLYLVVVLALLVLELLSLRRNAHLVQT